MAPIWLSRAHSWAFCMFWRPGTPWAWGAGDHHQSDAGPGGQGVRPFHVQRGLARPAELGLNVLVVEEDRVREVRVVVVHLALGLVDLERRERAGSPKALSRRPGRWRWSGSRMSRRSRSPGSCRCPPWRTEGRSRTRFGCRKALAGDAQVRETESVGRRLGRHRAHHRTYDYPGGDRWPARCDGVRRPSAPARCRRRAGQGDAHEGAGHGQRCRQLRGDGAWDRASFHRCPPCPV